MWLCIFALSLNAKELAIFQYSTDVRLMSNIAALGQLENGMTIYSWDWNETAKTLSERYGASEKDQGYAAVGFKAQDIQKLYPDAVIQGDGGYLRIIGSILVAQDDYIGQKVSRKSGRCANIISTRFHYCF